MREKKKKKLTEGEGFTISQKTPLSVSLASLSALGANAGDESNAAVSAADNENGEAAKDIRQDTDSPLKISRIALHRERAGRGGKTVTIVAFPKDSCCDAVSLARELRRSLGCGSSIEERNIALQGDLVERAAVWFAKKGVKNITKNGK